MENRIEEILKRKKFKFTRKDIRSKLNQNLFRKVRSVCNKFDKMVKIKPLFNIKKMLKEFLMLGNFAVILFKEHNLSTLLKVMKKSENKEVKKNGIRVLAIFSEEIAILQNKTFEFLSDVIQFDKDVDNLMNSLTFLANMNENIRIIDKELLKNKGFIAKLISLLRFLS